MVAARASRRHASVGVGARPRACARCPGIDQHRPAAGRAAGADVGVGVADHPRGGEVDIERRAPRRAASRAPACGSRRRPRARHDAVGVVRRRSRSRRTRTPSASSSSRTRCLDRDQLLPARPCPSPRRAGWRRRPAGTRPPRACRSARPTPWDQAHVLGAQRRLRQTGFRVGDELVEHAVRSRNTARRRAQPT